MKPIIGIACISNNRAIGNNNGQLIYEMNYDMKHFYKTTVTTKDPEKVNAVIMGNKTYKSMKKPLEKRINYVITHDCVSNSAESESINDNMKSNVHFYNNILNCIMEAQSSENIETIYIIGGASIYQFCFDLNLFDELILSYVHLPKSTSGSVFFPYIDFNKYYINNHSESIQVYDKKTQSNQQYTIYYLKKYDHVCDEFIKTLSF